MNLILTYLLTENADGSFTYLFTFVGTSSLAVCL